MRLGFSDDDVYASCKIDPWFLAQIRGIVETEARDPPQGPAEDRRRLAPPEGDGLLRRAARRCWRNAAKPTSPRHGARSACAPCSSASTPARPSSPRPPPTCTRPTRRRSPARRRRGAAFGPEEGRHPRRRAEPHRPGHRVRLLLLPRLLRAERGRLRDHHGQLQSRDGLDRLRHLRPALFRAADAGGRARDHRHRAPQRHAARRHRAVRRTDAAQARRGAGEGRTCRSSAPRPTPSTSPRTATASSTCSTSSSSSSRRTASPIRSSRRG